MFGALALYVYINLAVTVCGILALFCLKKRPGLVFGLMTLYCAVLSFMAFTAQPTNYTASRALALASLFVALSGVVLRFCTKKSVFTAKILLCCSCAISLALLF